jgi:hypothetical protein
MQGGELRIWAEVLAPFRLESHRLGRQQVLVSFRPR